MYLIQIKIFSIIKIQCNKIFNIDMMRDMTLLLDCDMILLY